MKLNELPNVNIKYMILLVAVMLLGIAVIFSMYGNPAHNSVEVRVCYNNNGAVMCNVIHPELNTNVELGEPYVLGTDEYEYEIWCNTANHSIKLIEIPKK